MDKTKPLFDMFTDKDRKELEKLKGEYRNSIPELKYYGSDLNKYLSKECSREMTVNNLDCEQYKRSKKILRFIESKHENEPMKSTQEELLRLLARIFKHLDKNKVLGLRYELFVVTGNYPYEGVKIEDYCNLNGFYILSKNEFNDFCNMEKTISEIINNRR